jgi:hypothetical protein
VRGLIERYRCRGDNIKMDFKELLNGWDLCGLGQGKRFVVAKAVINFWD